MNTRASNHPTSPERNALLLASAVGAPVLMLGYAVLRLVDGRDGEYGPGPAWIAGHVLFLLSLLLFGALIVGARRLVPATARVHTIVATGAAVAGLLGLAAFVRVVVLDIVVGVQAFDNAEMGRLSDRYEDVPGFLPGAVLYEVGPLLFEVGLVVLLVQLATVRPRRLRAWSPVLVVLAFASIMIDLDLLPLTAGLFLLGLAPLRHRVNPTPRGSGGVAVGVAAAMVAGALAGSTLGPAPAEAAIDRHLQQALDEVVAAGALGVLAEVREEHGSWRGSSGSAELDDARPVRADGHFRAGSITKTFVATVVLQLAAEGRLDLEDTVEQWLPGVVPGGDEINLRQLLNHTSGLFDYLGTLPIPDGFLDIRWHTWTPSQLVARGTAVPPAFTPPGSSWEYSNTNYILLGMVVGEVTGNDYRTEVERRILRPLRLHGTSMPGADPRIPAPHAHGYLPVDDGGQVELVDITAMNPTVMGASGEVISTAADLNRFYAALLGGELLPREQLRSMITVVPGEDYGLGLRRLGLPCGAVAYGHDGDGLGYSTLSYASADNQRQVTITITNPWRTEEPEDAMNTLLDRALCQS